MPRRDLLCGTVTPLMLELDALDVSQWALPTLQKGSRIGHSELPITDYPLPITHHRLPITDYLPKQFPARDRLR